jgi:hypothetical protein
MELGATAVLAPKLATSVIPIVFAVASDQQLLIILVDLGAELVDDRFPERNIPFEPLAEFLVRRIDADRES